MADYQAHVKQAKKNLAILSEINEKITNSWDWQVTTSYYVAVHLMNAHLAHTANIHYGSHEKVKNALFNPLSPAKVDEKIYLTYTKLENLSRRARYLCNDTDNKDENIRKPEMAFLTHDVHLKRSLIKLDELIDFFANTYCEKFDITLLDCIEIKNLSLKYFKHVDNRVKLIA